MNRTNCFVLNAISVIMRDWSLSYVRSVFMNFCINKLERVYG